MIKMRHKSNGNFSIQEILIRTENEKMYFFVLKPMGVTKQIKVQTGVILGVIQGCIKNHGSQNPLTLPRSIPHAYESVANRRPQKSVNELLR